MIDCWLLVGVGRKWAAGGGLELDGEEGRGGGWVGVEKKGGSCA